MMKCVTTELRQSVSRARVDAVVRFGFTERQARFLVTVLVFSGVFIGTPVPRLYRPRARPEDR
jgi:hypothetical protein